MTFRTVVDATPAVPAAAATLRPPSTLPAWLIAALTLLVLVVWLLPPLDFLKQGHTLFPVWAHTVAELVAVAVALLVFALCWHTDAGDRSGNALVIGCGFLAVGLIDIAHLLSYRGMPDFVTPAHTEKAINFWLVARLIAALTLLAVAWRDWPPLRTRRARYGLLAAALLLPALVVWLQLGHPALWPRTFEDDRGLTAFKIGAEYGLIALMGVAAIGFQRRVAGGRRYDALDLRTAALITILGELCFTLYSNVNDVFQLLGHAYKIVAYLYIYRAVFVVGVREPYERLRVEIGERRDAERRVEFLAFHDPLTELPNRVLARDRVERAIAAAHRRGGIAALLYLDLDHFKNVNDSLGHAAGDRLLKTVAARLRSTLRETDSICRQGGDEFLVVLGELADGAALKPVIDKLMGALVQPIHIDGQDIATTASIGIAQYPGDGGDFDTLLQKADTALYRAKDGGRNTFRFFDESMNAEAIERLQLRNGLRLALERGEFVLHYQPQVDLKSGRMIGVEALLRWQRPGEGLLPPARFIAQAEESGLIVPIGDWVIGEACRQAVAWQREGLPPITVAVNLSALQFARGDIEQVVERSLRDSGLRPECLELELTESILLSNTEQVLAAVQRLKGLGVRLSIDDFGTGYSSLSYLKRFAVDKLKIDRSFVADLLTDADDSAIVQAIVQMAHGLSLITIAEGVEDAAVARRLVELGCEEAQGYHFARPLPADALAGYLRRAPQG
ncbi:EAL domain-containing protein [Variovorax sp. YR752]|uniref:putative bifunctional diguanylate cyclase/phosphodiesterase n=1 Tax=Variovorax sp. YR752 TaxID=1884383 RepID=UPI0031377AC3